ncbi:acyltransferase family protein [Fodinibius halophilus]|uniref:DUF5009 domain-containing protein n=1 Tax=Fodinibius halophilus TaxID=1736908 RepID=A0A6M1T083_9BACT|nr:DUF5009 domain-containing protein [Fodinibius halophilus]NGP89518.1 DUF5009 domain-containing protein [Fodinibius halophilus]
MVQRRERLVSLDVFRGITIAGMILVNNPGSWSHVYAPLLHAEWHGWTPTDLIFPFFLFIVGVAMTYSFGKLFERDIPKSEIYKKVFKRSVMLFGIGLFMAVFPFVRFDPLQLYDFSSIRIMGVLQRIALCYLFASIIFMEFRKVKSLVLWTAGILIGYWVLMMAVPVPGHGAGVLTKEGNLATYLDQLLLGGHLWQPGWEPEGLLSTIPAVATVLIGLLTGKLLRSQKSDKEKVIRMFLYGNAGLVLGLIMDAWFPINKGLWTSSYVLFTGGFALHFLAICYWIIDMKGYKKWAKPFKIYGLNALAVYVLSSLMAKLLYLIPISVGEGTSPLKRVIYESLLLPIASPINASLIFAVGYILFWLWIMWMFYKREIFIKI